MTTTVMYESAQPLPKELKDLKTCEVMLGGIEPDQIPYYGILAGSKNLENDKITSLLAVDKGVPEKESVFYKILKGKSTTLVSDISMPYKENQGYETYYLPFFNPQAKRFSKTPCGILRAYGGKTSFEYEIVLATPDHFCCYIYQEVRAECIPGINLGSQLKHINELLENREKLASVVPNALFDFESKILTLPFSNLIGDYNEIEIEPYTDLGDMLVETRLIQNNNRNRLHTHIENGRAI